jgi:hypothetical protein
MTRERGRRDGPDVRRAAPALDALPDRVYLVSGRLVTTPVTHDEPRDAAPRGMKRRLLDRLDRWVERREQIRPIGDGTYILRMKAARYRGPRLVLADGTVVNPGDLVGELHLDNQRAAALHGEGGGGFRFREEILRLLPALAQEICTRPEYRQINALWGASLFWRSSSLAAKAGFEHRPLPPFTRWWLGTWERILLAAYHPDGRRRLQKGRRTELRQVWITRRTLLHIAERAGRRRGGGAGPGGPEDAPAREHTAGPSERASG